VEFGGTREIWKYTWNLEVHVEFGGIGGIWRYTWNSWITFMNYHCEKAKDMYNMEGIVLLGKIILK
jgi:hypothetical protein